MQKEIKSGLLLDKDGNVAEPGYAYSLVKEYRRKDIKASPFRIKEWDYYCIYDNNYAICLTIDDNYYMGLSSLSIIDFKKRKYITKSDMKFMTRGKVGFSEDSNIDQEIVWRHKNYYLNFKVIDGVRYIGCHIDNFDQGKDFNCNFILKKSLDKSMVIATPFTKKKHFYYNEKKMCLISSGDFSYGELKYSFSAEDTRGILDWGRGVWTYKNTWYWAFASECEDTIEKGFNLGYGFGDTSNASENMLFYDGEAYKLEDCSFNIPKDSKGRFLYTEPWTFTSKNGDIDLSFTPLLDRRDKTDILILKTLQHQVFGIFSGKIKVPGKEFEIKNIIGAAERVTNWY